LARVHTLHVQQKKMKESETKLVDRKKIILISCAASTGIAIHLYRQHYENGSLTGKDFIIAFLALLMIAAITFLVVRKANKG